jgi:hypothetical protein
MTSGTVLCRHGTGVDLIEKKPGAGNLKQVEKWSPAADAIGHFEQAAVVWLKNLEVTSCHVTHNG